MEDLKNDGPAAPAARPGFREGMLDVGDGHTIYWRSHGNPDGPAVVILHGGPGGASNPRWAEFFDATRWRVVMFDQRGCGRSTPFGELRANTLAKLVEDTDALRAALGIEAWAVFGGSWGTTLALAYGARYPERCTGFLLRGIFLARRQDIDWFLWDVRRVFPDAHARFLDAIERASGRRPANAAQVLDFAQAPLTRFDTAGLRLAQLWSNYEYGLSAVGPMPEDASAKSGDDAQDAPATATQAASPAVPSSAISMALLERHYMADELPPPDLLLQVHRIAHLPCYIVHGRFDMVCPADQAQALADAWSGAQLSIVKASGHYTFEPGIADALRRDAERLYADTGAGARVDNRVDTREHAARG
ncbi:prolyl aminopeptidase [Pararobbsia silviterrae]|uniref:Proline iminopeptidase n=1 Tax=Pararobbsia silviterrae TaxID=1792498 RepID=A0A494YDB8_9BURK|nr:prolyl aminopeptidase [Pararobbsia silviterrae]RKP58718.1 prolyl aminopeptidase [Pararobbsia silviterrae]